MSKLKEDKKMYKGESDVYYLKISFTVNGMVTNLFSFWKQMWMV